jgi:hypothetical protein
VTRSQTTHEIKQLARITFAYTGANSALPADLLTATVSQTVVELVAGVIAAVICFVFVGLQFSRMQLSRNGLTVLVASLESVINKQKDSLKAETETNAVLRNQMTLLCKMMEHININTPTRTEYAFAMSMATTLE